MYDLFYGHLGWSACVLLVFLSMPLGVCVSLCAFTHTSTGFSISELVDGELA